MDRGVALQQHWLQFHGQNNIPAHAMSVLMRVAFRSTASQNMGLWGWGSGAGNNFSQTLFWFNGLTLNYRWIDSGGNSRMSISGFPWTPAANHAYDIVCSWTGNTADKGTLYIDAVSQTTSGVPSLARPTDERTSVSSLFIGSGEFDEANIQAYVNEFVIWDTVIDPTNVTLTSGVGSLNGTARTAFVSSTTFDGSTYSDPGVSNVRNATNYTFAGTLETGTLVSSGGGPNFAALGWGSKQLYWRK